MLAAQAHPEVYQTRPFGSVKGIGSLTWPTTYASVTACSRSSMHASSTPQCGSSCTGAAMSVARSMQPTRKTLRPCRSAPAAAGVGVFPAGQKQARMELPALLILLQAEALVDQHNSPAVIAQVNDAVTAGATAVLLDGGSNAAALYEAAVRLKELLRERAALLLLDRLDIAAAVGAEGVVLSPTGVPVVVARKMQQGPTLLGQVVTSPEAAVAAAADGASFVLLQDAAGRLPGADALASSRRLQRSGNAIPVIAACTGTSDLQQQQQLPGLSGAADGFCMPLQQLQPAAAALAYSSSNSELGVSSAVAMLLQSLTEGHMAGSGSSSSGQASGGSSSSAGNGGSSGVTVKVPAGTGVGGSALRRLINTSKEALIADEKQLLIKVAKLLEEVVPQMDELSLLRDAITNLDDVFLVVVVGEFNSGKSTVINALLGEKFLADGILPTTNEISVLKYNDPTKPKPELIQQADGLFVRHLPAALLKEMNIVDTPGTNVILERQQRLTEEYVPRADLVLFVLSADRPLSESELAFLKYIRQWRKKVVFVVNKVDMLETEDEVQAVLRFVGSNASKLLQLDSPAVLPISGRAGLKAKLACGSGQTGGVLGSWEDGMLAQQPGWQISRFGEFEKFIYDFLVGADGAARAATSSSRNTTKPPPAAAAAAAREGGEGLRLKLQTPLFVADALLEAARARLQAELSAAQAELGALEAVRRQLQKFRVEMCKDAEAQRQVCKILVADAISRNNKFVDRTLQLSNIPALTGYLFGSGGGSGGGVVSGRWESEVVAGTFDQLAKQVAEHAAWLTTNCNNQLNYYNSYLSKHRLPGSGSSNQQTSRSSGGSSSQPPETAASSSSDDGAFKQGAIVTADMAAAVAAASGSKSLAAVAEFKPEAARLLLEAKFKDAFLGTAGSAAGAQGLGLLAAGWLGNTVEDVLALTVAGLVSYVAVLNLPLKRADIKAKVGKVANNFVDSVTAAMAEEADSAVEVAIDRVLQQVAPLEQAWQEEFARLAANEQRRAELAEALQAMEKRTANLQ